MYDSDSLFTLVTVTEINVSPTTLDVVIWNVLINIAILACNIIC